MTGAMILFGSSLFFLYALPAEGPGSASVLRWPRPMLAASAALLLLACIVGLLAQTIVLAGSIQDGFSYDALYAVLTGMSFGKSSVVRAAVAGLVLVGLVRTRPGQNCWWLGVSAGVVVCASFAWMGHGAATAGAAGLVHLVSDVLHTLAAGVWVGALMAFLILLASARRQVGESHETLLNALAGFSRIGSVVVSVLIATGLINSWFLIGLSGLPQLWSTVYGRLLTLKVILFFAMLGLAASNRFQLTPALGSVPPNRSPVGRLLLSLRNKVAAETAISIVVLGLVAWFGTLAPPMSGDHSHQSAINRSH